MANTHTSINNKALILASVCCADEGRDPPSLPEPSAILNAPHFTEVHNKLSPLDTARGPGQLQSFMLQILADFLTAPATTPFKKSRQSGEFPQDWRKAIIYPILKKGDPEGAVQYRPVDLTSVVKLLKKAFIFFIEPAWLPSLADPACPTFFVRKSL